MRTITSRMMVDDSFYYLEIARNIALGNGVTFDGTHQTNGFQPLIVPIFWFVPEVDLAIYGTKLLEAVLLAAVTVLLFRLVLCLTGGHPAAAWLAVACLFIPGPKELPVCRALILTMESGVSAVMILALAHLLLTITERGNRVSFRFAAGYGLILGLTFLARVDNAVLLMGILVWHLVQVARPGGRALVPKLSVAALVAAAIATVYLWWNFAEFGHLIPINGRVNPLRFQRGAKAAFDPRSTRCSLRPAASMRRRSRWETSRAPRVRRRRSDGVTR